MPLPLCECASHRFRQKPPSWASLIKTTFKSFLALKPWLVYMNFYAIILSRLTIHFLKNCFPISLLDFFPTSLIVLHTKAPMTSLSDRSTLQSLHSTLTIQPTFLKDLYIFFTFYETPRFLPQRRA